MGTPLHWLIKTSGIFQTQADWTGSAIPTTGDDAIIDAVGVYTVTSNANTTVDGVTTINTATLAIGAGTTFAMTNGTDGGVNAGTISVLNGAVLNVGTDGTSTEFTNAGKLLVSSTANPTLLGIVGDVTLDGGGAVTLSDSANNSIEASAGGSTSEITIGGTPHTGDTVSLTFTNKSLAGFPVTVSYKVGGADNQASIATGLANAIAANTALKAAHLTASVDLINLNQIDITETGAVAANTVVSDTLSTGSTETVTLAPVDGSLTPPSSVSYTLKNVNNTISGAGTIGDIADGNLTLSNDPSGIINATGTHTLTIATTNTVNNFGILEDTGKGGLVIKDTVANNGLIQAIGAGAHVDLDGGVIEGGELYSNTGAQIDVLAGKTGTLDGTTIGQVTNIGTVVVSDNATLLVTGDIDNVGTIKLSSAGKNATNLQLSDDTKLDGGGQIIMSSAATNEINGGGGSRTLTNINNTISGSGIIGDSGLTLVNELAGIINANSTTPLVLAASTSSTNAGIMEATGTGTLSLTTDFANSGIVEALGKAAILINGPTIDNNSGAVIGALSAGAHIDVGLALTGGSSATINGGTVSTVVGAKLDTVATKAGNPANALTIAGSTINNAGNIAVGDNTVLTLDNDQVANTGSITIGGATAATQLVIGSPSSGDQTLLSGGGKVTLTDSTFNSIVANGSANTTFENFNNIISGSGTIGDSNLTVQNDIAGLINSSGTKGMTFAATAVTNFGTIETTGAGGMTFKNAVDNTTGTIIAKGTGGVAINSTVTNDGGLIEAIATGAHIDLNSGAEIDDGNVSTVIGSKINVVANATITGATVVNAGSIAIASGSELTIDNSIHNTGSIAVNATSGAATGILIDDTTTLVGGGAVTLTDNSANVIQATGSDTLTNIDNIISGAGTIGNDGNNLSLENDGLINANAKINALILDTGGNAIVNTGTIELTGTGGLTIENDVTNTNGLILTNSKGAVLTIGDGTTLDTVAGGIVQDAAAGAVITLNDGAIVDAAVSTVLGSTINTAPTTTNTISGNSLLNAGTINVTNNSTLLLDGPVTNTGTIGINSSGTDTTLQVESILALTGHGKLTMTNSVHNLIESDGVNGPVVDGQETVQITTNTTFNKNDTVTLTFTNTDFANLPESVTYTLGAGETATTIAAALATLINTDAKLAASSISAHAVGDTITVTEPGLSSADTVITDKETGTGNETMVYGHGGQITGGSGDPSLLDNFDNTISGAGVIGAGNNDLAFINEVNAVLNSSGSALLDINTDHQTVINFGLMESTGSGGLKVEGALANFGKILANTGTVDILGSLTGTGTATIGQHGTLDLEQASHQNIVFASTLGGALQLGVSKEFSGVISGFGGANTDSIDLQDLAYNTVTPTANKATFTAIDNTHGTLAVTNGTNTVDLTLFGNYTNATFTAVSDGIGGTPGILIHDPPAPHIIHHHGDHLV